jgi:hypothetical protein
MALQPLTSSAVSVGPSSPCRSASKKAGGLRRLTHRALTAVLVSLKSFDFLGLLLDLFLNPIDMSARLALGRDHDGKSIDFGGSVIGGVLRLARNRSDLAYLLIEHVEVDHSGRHHAPPSAKGGGFTIC